MLQVGDGLRVEGGEDNPHTISGLEYSAANPKPVSGPEPDHHQHLSPARTRQPPLAQVLDNDPAR